MFGLRVRPPINTPTCPSPRFRLAFNGRAARVIRLTRVYSRAITLKTIMRHRPALRSHRPSTTERGVEPRLTIFL